MADTRQSIKKLIKEQDFDKLLVIELEKERLFPNREPCVYFGQFAVLFDLIPTLTFNTMLIKHDELRAYYLKYLKREKKIFTEDFQILKSAHFYLEWTTATFKNKPQRYYMINTKHQLNILDETKETP
jgi:hypothetical protein